MGHLWCAKNNFLYSILGTESAPMPIYMQIEPSNYCNQKCIMCGRQNISDVEQDDAKLSLGDFKKIIDKIPSLQIITLSGNGEPLTVNVEDMVKYAKEKGIAEVEFYSNLMLLTEKRAEKLVKSGIDRIFVSIDSANPKEYKKIRGTDFLAVLKGLENLNNAKKKLRKSNPAIIINTVIMKHNVNELHKIIDLASKMNCEANFKSMLITNKTTDLEIKNPQSVLLNIKEYAVGKKVTINITLKNRKINKHVPCYRLWFGAYINARGIMLPCCDMWKTEPVLGNLLTQSIESVWNGEEFRKLRKATVSKDLSDYSTHVQQTCLKCNLSLNDKIYKILNPWSLLKKE